MHHLKYLFIVATLLLCLNTTAVAQEKIPINEEDYGNQKVEMADQLRADGKIYVLLGVILIIFAGFTVYMVSLDRKVSKLEKEIGQGGH